jgi:hypothetical protein
MGSPARFNHSTFNPALNVGLDEFDLVASRAGLVGLDVAPSLEVSMQSGQYKVRELYDVLKEYGTARHSDGTYGRGDLRFNKDSYSTEEHGFEVPIDNRDASIHAGYWDAELEAAQLAQDVVLRNHTKRVVAAALAGTSLSEGADTVWTNIASSDPVKDVRDARIKIKEKTGSSPNALCVNWRIWEVLRDNSAIRDRLVNIGIVGGASQPMLSRDMVAMALDLEFLFVSGGQRNATNEPAEPSTLTDIWDNTKALLFIRGNGSLKMPQYMRTFHWGDDGSSIGGTYETYHNDEVRSDVFRFRMETDEKVVYADAACVITSVA